MRESCALCGHVHDYMAVCWYGDTKTILCHEDDHSCYEAWYFNEAES